VLLIARHGKVAYFENIGFLDPQAKSPMPKNAMFHIYSMSKPITTVVAMILFEEGKITLDESIGKYIPALTNLQVVDQSLLLYPRGVLSLSSMNVSIQPVVYRQRSKRSTTGFSFPIHL
jgi:CubicO group peptidase (beta-lactamase class C family)